MTESEWMNCVTPDYMLSILRGKAHPRKFRMCIRACWNEIKKLLSDKSLRDAIEAYDNFAELGVGKDPLHLNMFSSWGRNVETMAVSVANTTTTLYASGMVQASLGNSVAFSHARTLFSEFENDHKTLLANLIRDIFNPFFFNFTSETVPKHIITLAEAAYVNERDFFALHNALSEAGFPELSLHFQNEKHYKGCWALDEILKKDGRIVHCF
jgi:hypothetical protein